MMKKKFFIFITQITMLFGYSQTKLETENWIKEKYENYYFKDEYPEKTYQSVMQITFDRNFVNLNNSVYQNTSLFSIGNKQLDLSKVKYIESSKEFWKFNSSYFWSIKLYCNNSCVESTTKWVYTGKVVKDQLYFDEDKYIHLRFDTNFFNDNLPQRMEKALIDLVKLSGGKAVLKKEAF